MVKLKLRKAENNITENKTGLIPNGSHVPLFFQSHHLGMCWEPEA